MTPETYDELLKDLQKREKTLVPAYVATLRADPELTRRIEERFRIAEIGGRFDDFAALCCRRSAVQFLLRTVYVRVLEDLGALEPPRIRGDWGLAAFREVAPALGVREFLKWTFRDLSRDFPSLFKASPEELPLPSEDLCRETWDLWHRNVGDKPVYAWTADTFDSHFLGNLYQDLDAEVRKRFALLQTPMFVEKYILDHTLTPALAEFDPIKLREKGETFRLIDPTCGSGHFLSGAFHRLADYWQNHGVPDKWEAARLALESVWGCDINPHAVDIARFRLMLEVRARTGVTQLERLASLTFNLRVMDSLIPWERGATAQGELFPAMDRLSKYATPGERAENASFLHRAFNVVVGNPPYIRPKDPLKTHDYRAFWPKSATGKYAMSAPFIERFFVLGKGGSAYIGQINASSFMTRAFGKRLIQEVLPTWEITRIVDTSMAALPGHGMKGGTATFIFFGRSLRCTSEFVGAVVCKRGEPPGLVDPAKGLVWGALIAAPKEGIYSNAFAEAITIDRRTLNNYPWSIGTSQENIIKECIEESKDRLWAVADIGSLTKPVLDDIYVPAPSWLHRLCPDRIIPMLEGACIRDWAPERIDSCIFPYSLETPDSPLSLEGDDLVFRYFWPYRTLLWDRRSRASKFAALSTIPDAKFYEFPFYYPITLSRPFIAMAFQTTDNQFLHHDSPALVKQTAPAITLRHKSNRKSFDLLGILNSSTIQFWISRVFTPKGRVREEWDNWREIDSKLKLTPLPNRDIQARELFATAIDSAASERSKFTPRFVLSDTSVISEEMAESLLKAYARYQALTHRMVALQEELDWLTYGSYSLIDPVPTVLPEDIEPLAPGHRPFEILLARDDDEADDDEKSAWWSRHGHDRVTEIPAHYSEAMRARIQSRMDLIESDPKLQLLEQAAYKRRWQTPDFDTETKSAAESFLLDRLEDLFAPGGPLAKPAAYRLEQVVDAWLRDPRTVAVARIWQGNSAGDLTLAAEQLLRAHGLPDNPYRVYTPEGLRTLAVWQKTWHFQDLEDQEKPLIDPDTGKLLDSIPLPPKFDRTHFKDAAAFAIRGKLNVSRERFILFADLTPMRYGWNGWRDTARADAQVAAYTIAEQDPGDPLPPPTVADPRRCGPTLGLWDSLPDVERWGDAATHAEILSLAQEVCRQKTCPCAVLDAWQEMQLKARAKRPGRKPSLPVVTAAKPPQPELTPTVTIDDRALVHRELLLFGDGGATLADLGKKWQRDAEHLARVLDDLVASGDLKTRGRGRKKLYIATPSGARTET